MPDRHPDSTSPTLLARLRRVPSDQTAWGTFVTRYGTLLRLWSRRWGLQQADAEDLVQSVLLDLARQLRDFEYDKSKSFRGWLKTIAYRTWCDYLERCRRQRDTSSGDSRVLAQLDNVEAREDFLQKLEEEWERELLEEGMRLAKQRVQPHTWEAFRLMTQERLSGAEVAQRLNMKVGAVWVAKSKVQKIIHEEVQRLEQDEATDEAPERES